MMARVIKHPLVNPAQEPLEHLSHCRLRQHEPCGGRRGIGRLRRAVWQGGAETVCRGCRRSAGHLVEEWYLQRHGIPARMFNGVRVSLEGKVASIKEQQKLRVESLWREPQVFDVERPARSG